MITLAADCLLFEIAAGESIPYSADMIAVELGGDTAERFDSEFVRHATKAVFHYFKHELGRQAVSLGEFARALEKVLGGFAATTQLSAESDSWPRVQEFDLCRLADESGPGRELFFFPRLRAELQRGLRQAPRLRGAGVRAARTWRGTLWPTSGNACAPNPRRRSLLWWWSKRGRAT